ncbi:acyl-CoA synthetase [Rhizobiaceae bacterium]|nr:acyl-CoA synthetase [Rhizobiaceae bacterium]
MKHPCAHALTNPDKTAYRMAGSGQSLTFAELDAASNRNAQALRSLGVGPGDHIAFMLENRLELLALVWGAQRSGVIFTAISRYLTADEAAYIVGDCGARVFITSHAYLETAERVRDGVTTGPAHLMIGEPAEGFASWDALVASMPMEPVADECAGSPMLYSSGTTGRPKGIRRDFATKGIEYDNPIVGPVFEGLAGMTGDSVYLSPAPLYHSAPLSGAMVAAALGATTIIMEKFDETGFLELVEREAITHTQVVPTMFVRLLKLPDAVRQGFDVSSLEGAVHVAAPCPVEIKRAMIDWWGPIIVEYYAGTEGNGVCGSTSAEWLARPGTVGRALIGEMHILDDARGELPKGEIGDVFFDAGLGFAYFNDPEKTAHAFTAEGWSTLGDIGWMDDHGFVFLTDRRAYTIISGGVNVYPQEVEDLLINHPSVADIAVFGVPSEALGEEVKAVVEPAPGVTGNAALERELIAYCRARLSVIKSPKSVDFTTDMPRTPTGKLMKRLLKDKYWGRG